MRTRTEGLRPAARASWLRLRRDEAPVVHEHSRDEQREQSTGRDCSTEQDELRPPFAPWSGTRARSPANRRTRGRQTRCRGAPGSGAGLPRGRRPRRTTGAARKAASRGARRRRSRARCDPRIAPRVARPLSGCGREWVRHRDRDHLHRRRCCEHERRHRKPLVDERDRQNEEREQRHEETPAGRGSPERRLITGVEHEVRSGQRSDQDRLHPVPSSIQERHAGGGEGENGGESQQSDRREQERAHDVEARRCDAEETLAIQSARHTRVRPFGRADRALPRAAPPPTSLGTRGSGAGRPTRAQARSP
jgi:hypothetical protein